MARDNNLVNVFNLPNTLRSVRSSASLGSHFIEDQVDFADVFVGAVYKFECPVTVDVCRYPLHIASRKSERISKIGRAFTPLPTVRCELEGAISSSSAWGRCTKTKDLADSVLILRAVYNFRNRLVEILIYKYRYTPIPRVVMQVLTLILPSYTKLSKFTLKNCSVDKYTIPELKNILSVTNITDVCLDSSFLPEGNYDVLLQQATSLKNLSLMRCYINDVVCKKILAKLHYGQPAEKKLLALNLSSNNITDEGAESIGEALRSNRHLQYLNLANNLITDVGIKYIFDVLKEFTLTNDELLRKREQCIRYLKQPVKCNVRAKDIENNSDYKIRQPTRRSSSITSILPIKNSTTKNNLKTGKRSCLFEDNSAILKSDIMTSDVGQLFEHPFLKTQLINKEDHSCCKGNLVLSYLNVAYNNLMHPSVLKLLEVLEYQKIVRSSNWRGLVKVVMDGNNLPVNCTELDNINVIFKEIMDKVTRN